MRFIARMLLRFGLLRAVEEAVILRLLHQRDAAWREADDLRRAWARSWAS